LNGVIAGLDPAIHEEFLQRRPLRTVLISAMHHGCAGQARA
jgi:hypothetical protein